MVCLHTKYMFGLVFAQCPTCQVDLVLFDGEWQSSSGWGQSEMIITTHTWTEDDPAHELRFADVLVNWDSELEVEFWVAAVEGEGNWLVMADSDVYAWAAVERRTNYMAWHYDRDQPKHELRRLTELEVLGLHVEWIR